MSGLEIAGLVLGAIPIAIETLKMESEGIVIFQRSRRYENELERLMNKFENGVRLQDVCENLLVDLVPHSRIQSLVQNPVGLFKDEPGRNTKLRRRLWKGFDLFSKILGDLKTAMEEATERINIQVQDKSNLRRSLRHSFLDDLLSRINEGITVLGQLVDRGIEFEPARKRCLQGKFLCLMRNLANGVFGAVRAGFDCPCEHHVCLQLEKRIIDMVPDDAEDYLAIDDINFHLNLSYKSTESKTPPLSSNDRAWFEMLVKATPKPLPQAQVQREERQNHDIAQ